MLFALVLAVVAPFTILKDNCGRPLMSVSDLKLPDISMPDIGKAADEIPGTSGQLSVIYEWTDAKGNLNFTTEAPPAGVAYVVKTYDPNSNVIQAVKPIVEAAATSEENSDSSAARGDESAGDGLGNPYSPQQIEKLFDDAKNVQKQLNERVTKQQQMIENL